MKKVFTYFIGGLLSLNVEAQVNLVPNPSFEDTVHCPTGISQIYNAQFWINPSSSANSTPDYFNLCTTSPSVSVPSNAWGNQAPNSGNAYAGFYAFNKPFPNTYEYIETALKDSLKRDSVYCVSFYLCLADNMSYCTNNIGIYFSNSLVTTPINIILASPQLVNIGTTLSSKSEWMKVEWKYTASGGEKFLTIGNFNNTFSSDTIYVGGAWPDLSYYYIDDIFVGKCDAQSSVIIIPNIFTPNNDGVNDFWEIENLPLNSKVEIFNRWGIKVTEMELINGGLYSWDGRTTAGEMCSDGTFFYLITTPQQIYKGFVQAIR